MHSPTIIVASVLATFAFAMPAAAQRTPFERGFDVGAGAVVDITTVRGEVAVVAADTSRVSVNGTVTVRVGWGVPANAVALAQRVAANPPVSRTGDTIRLTVPADDAERRAVTVSYVVTVPLRTHVKVVTESGATTISKVTGPVEVRTQSAAISLADLGGSVEVTTGSGAVDVARTGGALSVRTQSSAFEGRELGGAVRVRTGSGAVYATLTGAGDVDIQTQSSSIDVAGLQACALLASGSGRIKVSGTPRTGTWTASTGSGSIELALDRQAPFQLDATTGSGSVTVKGVTVNGVHSKKRIAGDVEGGGPLVKATSRSGSVRVERRLAS